MAVCRKTLGRTIQPFLGMEVVGCVLSCDIKIKLKSLFLESFNIPILCNGVVKLK